MEQSCIRSEIMTKRFKVILIDFEKVLKKEKVSSHLGWLLSCISVYLLLNSLPKKVVEVQITFQFIYRRF